MKHGRSAYIHGRCGCDFCKQAHARYAAELRARRMTLRTLVDGRWVAPLPAEKHGSASAYNNHGCRCDPCTDAAVAAVAQHQARRGVAT